MGKKWCSENVYFYDTMLSETSLCLHTYLHTAHNHNYQEKKRQKKTKIIHTFLGLLNIRMSVFDITTIHMNDTLQMPTYVDY